MEQTIEEKIKQRRLQMLVHSCIYYEMNQNIVSDSTWSRWAIELAELQDSYPEEAETTIWADVFRDWDGSSGAFLPLQDQWVQDKARQLLYRAKPELFRATSTQAKKKAPTKKTKARKLF